MRPAVVTRAPGDHGGGGRESAAGFGVPRTFALDGRSSTGIKVRHGNPPWKDRAVEGASRTAIMTAQFRAAHALVDRDPIFEDRFALALADCSAADVRDFLAANAPDSCGHVVRLFVCQRSRFVEEEVEGAVGSGVDQ